MSRYQTQAATADDIAAVLAIKQSLRPSSASSAEGFILGSSHDLYQAYVEHAIFKTLKRDNKLIGYAICLPDKMLRQSELWQKKEQIDFSIPIATIIAEKIAYFEQLAVLPNYRYHLVKLLLPTLDTCFEQHGHMFSTSVCEPFVNRAAQGLYRRAVAQTVGKLREFYPEHGAISSQLHYLSRANYLAAKHKWHSLVAAMLHSQ